MFTLVFWIFQICQPVHNVLDMPEFKLQAFSRIARGGCPEECRQKSVSKMKKSAGSFNSIIFNQQIIPKLRNIKIELTYVEEVRDMIDLKHEHIVALSRIIGKLEQLYKT